MDDVKYRMKGNFKPVYKSELDSILNKTPVQKKAETEAEKTDYLELFK